MLFCEVFLFGGRISLVGAMAFTYKHLSSAIWGLPFDFVSGDD
jgi:hypothetical protein